MRWQQTEFLLKGLYLGLLVLVAMHRPTWMEIGQVWACTLSGLVVCLGVAGYQKIRDGFRVQGRWGGFILFLLLENPGMVYAGILVGLTIGTTGTFRDHPLTEHADYLWLVLGPLLGGVILGR